METKRTIEELKAEAIEVLKHNDDIFVDCVNELDSWDGFADGFRAYSMFDLDDLYCDCKVSKFINDLTDNFSIRDEYFYFSVYGLESCNDVAGLYHDNVYESELLDELIDNYSHINIAWIDGDFDDLIAEIVAFN